MHEVEAPCWEVVGGQDTKSEPIGNWYSEKDKEEKEKQEKQEL